MIYISQSVQASWFCRVKSQTPKRHLQRVQAIEWPDKELLDSVEENFPDAGVADAEEARVNHIPKHRSIGHELHYFFSCKRASFTCFYHAYFPRWDQPHYPLRHILFTSISPLILISCLQALFSNFGYTYLDVRPSLELEEVGKVKGSVNVPIVNASRKYSSEKQKKVLQKEDNPNFIQEVSLSYGKILQAHTPNQPGLL